MIELIIVAVIAFAIGYSVSQTLHLITLKNILNDLGITNQQLIDLARNKGIDVKQLTSEESEDDPNSDLPELELRIEQHPEGLFAYRKADNTFIAQGQDRETLMENIIANLNNVRVIVRKEDGGDLISP